MGLNLKGLFSGGLKGLGDSAKGIIAQVAENKMTVAEADILLEKELNRHAEVMEANTIKEIELVLSDKQNAREMFKANSNLQKIYALAFLIGYILLSSGMIYMIFNLGDYHMPEWGIGMLSTIWGAMSMKVGTVTDFLFGASMSPEKP